MARKSNAYLAQLEKEKIEYRQYVIRRRNATMRRRIKQGFEIDYTPISARNDENLELNFRKAGRQLRSRAGLLAPLRDQLKEFRKSDNSIRTISDLVNRRNLESKYWNFVHERLEFRYAEDPSSFVEQLDTFTNEDIKRFIADDEEDFSQQLSTDPFDDDLWE